MKSHHLLDLNNFPFQLIPIDSFIILYFKKLPFPIYSFFEGKFDVITAQNAPILEKNYRDLMRIRPQMLFFIENKNKEILKTLLNEDLRLSGRSVSMGDPLVNGKKLVKLLALNLSILYEDPTDIDSMNLQFQTIRNLYSLIESNTEILSSLYQSEKNSDHPFYISQAILSSLLLVGYLIRLKPFSKKETEMLFLSSFFKDIGMSSILPEKLKSPEPLDKRSIEQMRNHSLNSYDLLEGNLPFNENYLLIIKNHHIHSKIENELIKSGMVFGAETTLISVSDTIVAMTTDRPYRPATQLYQSLTFIKEIMGNEYNQEFKHLVFYLMSFFRNK